MIREIDSSSAAQLKSGQVIVELSNALKELVENAIDANATSITVKVFNYGLDGLQVTDNGDGIDPDDFEYVAKAHSTSKISSFNDLTSVQTLGFRGEALASLCQVAKLTIQTSQGEKGYKLEFNRDGSISKKTVVPSPKGCTVSLTDFFTGLPVRRKDLERNYKRKYTEALCTVQAYAVIWDGTVVIEHVMKGNKRSTVLKAQGSDMSDRISLIFGPKTASNIINIDAKGCNVHIIGRISRPLALIKGQRSSTRLLYINGRPVNDKHISKMVLSIFQEYEPHGSPFFVLNLLISPEQLDINITPDKRDVRLLQGYKVMGEIDTLLRKAIENKGQQLHRGASVQAEQQPIGGELLRFLGSGPIRDQNGQQSQEGEDNSQSQNESDPELEQELPRKFPRTESLSSRPSSTTPTVQLSLKSFTYDKDSVTISEPDSDSELVDGEGAESITEEPLLQHLGHTREPLGSSENSGTSVTCDILPQITTIADIEPSQTEEYQTSPESGASTPVLDSEANREDSNPDEDICCSAETAQLEVFSGNKSPSLPPVLVSKSLNCHISLPTSIEEVEASMAQLPNFKDPTIRNFALDGDTATERLNLTIVKSDFSHMEVIGQFNLGFILVLKRHGTKNDIFIIDQHASDEIYNFERLQKSTVMRRQPLVVKRQLELSAVEELTVVNNLHVFERNGFSIKVDPEAPPGKQCFLTALPYSKGTIFNESDINELVYKISESQGDGSNLRCSKLRSMFAMRACRSSIMVGDALSLNSMKRIVSNLGTLDKPWNCPHGRPTLRHITTLG